MGEQSYLNLVRECIETGNYRMDRTKVGTYSLFGKQLEFDLGDGLPLLTTKQMFCKGILKELLWIMKGQTNSKILDKDGVKFWNDNSTRQFLDSNSLYHYEEGELGPIYGFQWRHAGKPYKSQTKKKMIILNILFGLLAIWKLDISSSLIGLTILWWFLFTEKHVEIDQLRKIVEQLKTDSSSRRIIICSWNVTQLHEMALPPCHCLVQFYVRQENNIQYLDCQLYQRSADLGLGVPFNIASYSFLVHVLAKWTNLTPGRFIHTFGDVHVYVTHIEALKKQIDREPYPFPSVTFEGNFTLETLDAVTSEEWCQSFSIRDYKYHPLIKMPMAV